ncbi:MAG: YIEGIA family protein [Clostridioides sp.]|jgi:hypothetical protein|nr:YIEGIA family protein [Clostridioides sp.]
MEKSMLSAVVFRQSLIVSVIIGILCRGLVLVMKNKQYPSRPQDYLEQIISSGLAASLGAIALPALLDKEYSALTFFAIAIQQFQGLADQERITLKNTDNDEMVPKGDTYVEEISSTYETRSYISLFSALFASVAYITTYENFSKNFVVCTVAATIAGVVVGIVFKKYLTRKSIGDIADIVPAELYFEGPLLKIGENVIGNIGMKATRDIYMEKGMGIRITPKKAEYFGILNDAGQRQAILHNIYIHLGIDKDIDEFDITASTKSDMAENNIVVSFVPMLRDMSELIESAKSTPILEISKGKEGYFKAKV